MGREPGGKWERREGLGLGGRQKPLCSNKQYKLSELDVILQHDTDAKGFFSGFKEARLRARLVEVREKGTEGWSWKEEKILERRKDNEVAEGDRDAEDNEQRKEKEGEEKTASGKQDEKEKKIEKERRAVIIKSLTQSYCSGYSAELRGILPTAKGYGAFVHSRVNTDGYSVIQLELDRVLAKTTDLFVIGGAEQPDTLRYQYTGALCRTCAWLSDLKSSTLSPSLPRNNRLCDKGLQSLPGGTPNVETAALRKAPSIQNVTKIEKPWENVTLNRCLLVAITILVLTSGFQRLHEALRGQGAAEEEEEVELTVRRTGTLRQRRQPPEPEATLWEVMFGWLPDLDDEEDGDDDEDEDDEQVEESKRGEAVRAPRGLRNKPLPDKKLMKQREGTFKKRKGKKDKGEEIRDKNEKDKKEELDRAADEEDEDGEEEEAQPEKNTKLEEKKKKKKTQKG
ncbi:hypothetical protein EYF80_011602 [Liparis tanakae]|uniref:Uncharacterized protein n=1 Tax=Liparis tanakae TaxID=230148 RepID=A0A4Z2IJX9_9TELE|nr:hypothetical protein EYF80_011602 [Liparis tanakae]